MPPLRPPLLAAALSCLACSAAFASGAQAQDLPPLVRALPQPLAQPRTEDGFIAVLPSLTTSYNSAHGWGWNDGPLRSGKGANLIVSAGFVLRARGVTLQVVPQLVHEANGYLPVIPYGVNETPPRTIWANPFHPTPESIDYPLRFGDQPRTALYGQHRLSVSAPGQLEIGLSTENRWWGPGVRNALLLGAQSAGFGHFFIESRAPWQTRLGSFDAQYLLGRLNESEFFDTDPSNDSRSLSAAAVTWSPPAGLDALLPELGIARAVMSTGAPGLKNTFDFLHDVGRPFADSADALRGRDQITSVFARWSAPASGLLAWFEWARYEQPINLRDLLVNPGHSQGYTLGLSWTRPLRGGALETQTELTYAEPSASIRVRPVGISYTSPSVPQGWTHEGEMIGPAIGPGGSSQWLAFDWRRDTPAVATAGRGRVSRVGLSLGRLRRDNGEPFEQPAESFKREDISLWATLRVGWRIGPVDALVEFTDAARLNYLYQAFDLPPEQGGWSGIDLRNRTISLTLSPRLR